MSKMLIWLLMGVLVVVVLLTFVLPRGNQISSPGTSAPPSTIEGEKGAATLPPRAEEPPPRPSDQPSEWRVLFSSPKMGEMGISRQSAIKLFFNIPVERDVVERAFTISPSVAGTFSWPKADQLVFTPDTPLLPATQYTVSLTPMRGSRGGEPYILVGANWSFTTGGSRTYRKDIRPLIAAYCTKCHGPAGPASHIPLETYQDVSRYVVPGRSGESRFYTFIQDRLHHINMAGPNHSTNDKLAVIKDWIDVDGAVE